MQERYPYIRFLIASAEMLAAAVAGVVFLGGTVGACSRGGWTGLVSFLLVVVVTGLAWTLTMAAIECLAVLLSIEEHTRAPRATRPEP
ncbi:MAG: hypothetical protein KatS3mg076_0269 [Candidatus Binatia bacterium]|nr:MAG: hypothetical protein KatS3mg076_0269 [Candidatus Binatia bacterium]